MVYANKKFDELLNIFSSCWFPSFMNVLIRGIKSSPLKSVNPFMTIMLYDYCGEQKFRHLQGQRFTHYYLSARDWRMPYSSASQPTIIIWTKISYRVEYVSFKIISKMLSLIICLQKHTKRFIKKHLEDV